MKINIVTYLLSCFLLIGFSCKNEMKVSNEILIEQKVEALLKQMTLDEKNQYSHRARAIEKLVAFFNTAPSH